MGEATARVKMRLLSRLILSEIAERQQKSDEQLLDELIYREAVKQLEAQQPAGRQEVAAC